MSAFDDEFGLFGDEPGEEEERRSTLGARTIASGETIIDDVEPEDEPAPRRRRGVRPEKREFTEGSPRRRFEKTVRPPLAEEIALPRAVELLTFLAKKLVSNPEAVVVELHTDVKGPVLELEVDPADLGKVIGRGGRVAQALRTLVRAGAEGRVTVDIIDVDDELDEDEDGEPIAGGESVESSASGESAEGSPSGESAEGSPSGEIDEAREET